MTILHLHPRAVPSSATEADEDARARMIRLLISELSSPGSQSAVVANALSMLTSAWSGTETFPQRVGSSVTSTATNRFDSVVGLISNVIRDLDEDGSVSYLFEDPLPHFVPPGWVDRFRVHETRMPDVDLPWLAELDD